MRRGSDTWRSRRVLSGGCPCSTARTAPEALTPGCPRSLGRRPDFESRCAGREGARGAPGHQWFGVRVVLSVGHLKFVAVVLGAAGVAACSTPNLRGGTYSVDGFGEAPRDVGQRKTPRAYPLREPRYANQGPSDTWRSQPSGRGPAVQYRAAGDMQYRAAGYGAYDGGAPASLGVRRTSADMPSVERGQLAPRSNTPVAPAVRATSPAPRQAIRTTQPMAQTNPVNRVGLTAAERTGWARWMGRSWSGHKTASGETFDPERLTGAHPRLPLPSFAYVTNRANGRTLLIRINDRVRAVEGRAVVVSRRAAELLGFREGGQARVDLQYAGAASRLPNGRHEEAFLKKQPWFDETPMRAKTASAAKEGDGRYSPPEYPRWDNSRR